MPSTRLHHPPVHGLRTGRLSLGLNTQSICYRLGDALIDTGPPNRWKSVRSFVLDEARRGPINKLLLTHHHEDHAGNAAAIGRLLGIPVYAPEASLDKLRAGSSSEFYRRLVWGRMTPVEARRLPEEVDVGDGFQLHSLPAPGHAADMVCLWEADRGWLFSADLFISTRLLYLHHDEDATQLIATLRRIAQHPIKTLFCSHRGIVPEGKKALDKKLRFLEGLQREASAMWNSGKDVTAITRALLGREGPLYWTTGGGFSKRRLIESLLSKNGDLKSSTDPGQGR